MLITFRHSFELWALFVILMGKEREITYKTEKTEGPFTKDVRLTPGGGSAESGRSIVIRV